MQNCAPRQFIDLAARRISSRRNLFAELRNSSPCVALRNSKTCGDATAAAAAAFGQFERRVTQIRRAHAELAASVSPRHFLDAESARRSQIY